MSNDDERDTPWWKKPAIIVPVIVGAVLLLVIIGVVLYFVFGRRGKTGTARERDAGHAAMQQLGYTPAEAQAVDKATIAAALQHPAANTDDWLADNIRGLGASDSLVECVERKQKGGAPVATCLVENDIGEGGGAGKATLPVFMAPPDRSLYDSQRDAWDALYANCYPGTQCKDPGALRALAERHGIDPANVDRMTAYIQATMDAAIPAVVKAGSWEAIQGADIPPAFKECAPVDEMKCVAKHVDPVQAGVDIGQLLRPYSRNYLARQQG